MSEPDGFRYRQPQRKANLLLRELRLLHQPHLLSWLSIVPEISFLAWRRFLGQGHDYVGVGLDVLNGARQVDIGHGAMARQIESDIGR